MTKTPIHPRLQVAFDVMYPKCQGYMPANRAKECDAQIRQGNLPFAIGEVADGLTQYEPTEQTAPRYIKAVEAFGEFWSVFTNLRKSAQSADKRGGAL